jgi:hypothetical protein
LFITINFPQVISNFPNKRRDKKHELDSMSVPSFGFREGFFNFLITKSARGGENFGNLSRKVPV